MSAIPQQGPHVRELFVKTGPAVGLGSFEADQQESRSSYDLNSKKRRAPAPPVGLGQYKPKILSDSSDGNVPLNSGNPGPQNSHPSGSSQGPIPDPSLSAKTNDASKSKPFIMGDKDTPLVLHSPRGNYGPEPDIRDLKVSANHEGEGVVIGTSNPLFDLQAPKANGDVSLANGKVAHYEKRREKKEKEDGEPEGVYIPAPDYDEEEKTMVFSDEPEDDTFSSEQPGKKIYKEYYGEDFSQYLSDEENGLDDLLHRQKRSSQVPDRKSKTEVKRGSHYKKRESLPGKGKKDKSFRTSSSLRNFSYADSKFGTVSGSNRRPSVHSLSEDTEEAELFVNTGSSYEHFLRSKNGEEVSFFEAGTSQVPARYTRPSHKKDTLWKKLTWKFKKQSKNRFDIDPS